MKSTLKTTMIATVITLYFLSTYIIGMLTLFDHTTIGILTFFNLIPILIIFSIFYIEKSLRKHLIILSILFIIPCATITYVQYTNIDDYHFTVKKWNDDEMERYFMAEKIVEERSLIGKNERKIKKLLGEPSENMLKENKISYRIGMDMIDYLYLVIEFNEQGIVVKSYIMQG